MIQRAVISNATESHLMTFKYQVHVNACNNESTKSTHRESKTEFIVLEFKSKQKWL